MKNFGPVSIFSIFNQDCNYIESSSIDLWHHYNIDKQSSFLQLVERVLRLLRRKGLRYYWAYVNAAARELDEVIKEFKPNLVILEELGVYPYLSVIKNHKCHVIFDNHNVEANLFKQINCSDKTLASWAKTKFHLPQIQSAESNLISEANQVWLCSKDDTHLLQKLYGSISHSYVIPNAIIDISYYDYVRLGKFKLPNGLESKSHNLLFLGNFYHRPNSDAAKLIIEDIYPRLRKVFPDSLLLLVGNNATQFMLEAAQKDTGIIVTGEVREKGGKVYRLNAQDGKHLLIRDEIESIVDAVIQLWSEPELGQKLVDAAYEFVQSKYSWEAVGLQLEKAIKKLF
jgi:hypothetical protein